MEAIYQHLSQPLPRQEGMQLVGKKPTAQPQLVLGDMLPNRNAADDDVALAITWLELMARLGYLRRNENWSKLYERFLDDSDEHGVQASNTTPGASNPYLWPLSAEDHLAATSGGPT
jgi:hypothetical protein